MNGTQGLNDTFPVREILTRVRACCLRVMWHPPCWIIIPSAKHTPHVKGYARYRSEESTVVLWG